MNPFALSAIAAVAVNAAFFAYAAARKTDVVTDLSYSLSFLIVCLVLLAQGAESGLAALVPALLTSVWAVRLGAYLFGRIRKTKVDHRFDGMRDKPLKFAKFWILQALAVFVILLPVSASAASQATSPTAPRSLGAWEFLGVALWLAGFLIEVIADAQKSAFKRSGATGFIASGLWRYSRHPNYFGEALLWWGLLVYAVPALSGALWVAALGPAFITVLLLFVSGIPLLEKEADRKYGDDPAYREYKRRTSVFVPWLRAR